MAEAFTLRPTATTIITFTTSRAAAATAKPITAGDWAVFSAAISPQALFIVTNQGKPEERQFFRVPFDGGTPLRLSQPARHARAG